MTLNYRNDTYAGYEHYWIRYQNGTFEVRQEMPDWCDNNKTVFAGSYDQCLDYISQKVNEYNAETMSI